MKTVIALTLLLAASTGFAERAEAKPSSDSKPNIIVIMPDDIGYGDIASLGNPVVQTPNLDSLKRESLLLTQYHVSPRCSPSRAVLMGGRHEFMSGVTHTQHDARTDEPWTP